MIEGTEVAIFPGFLEKSIYCVLLIEIAHTHKKNTRYILSEVTIVHLYVYSSIGGSTIMFFSEILVIFVSRLLLHGILKTLI